MADSENCGCVTSLCPDFRLWPGLYDIYPCLRGKGGGSPGFKSWKMSYGSTPPKMYPPCKMYPNLDSFISV